MKKNTHSDLQSRIYSPRITVLILSAVLLWTSVALFNSGMFVFSTNEQLQGYKFFEALGWTLLYHIPWLLFFPCVLFLGRRFPLNQEVSLINLAGHLSGALLIASTGSFFHTYIIYIRLGEAFQLSGFIGNFYFYSVDRLLIYFVILMGYYAIDYYRKQNEESLKKLKLQETINRQNLNSFKNNIQPRFLLNTLRDIEEMIYSTPALAEQLIADLAHEIRKMLKNSQKETVNTHDDLHFLKSYISILGVRLNNDIQIHESVDEKNKDKELAISLFVIYIVEQLLERDEHMFQSFNRLLYETFETEQSHVINVELSRLDPSGPDFEKWLNNGGAKALSSPFSKNIKEHGTAKVNYSTDGTLLFSINLTKNLYAQPLSI